MAHTRRSLLGMRLTTEARVHLRWLRLEQRVWTTSTSERVDVPAELSTPW